MRRKIESSWTGEKYIHGPRRTSPSKYDSFRLGPELSSGKRLVYGRIRGTNKWELQSQLRPRIRKVMVIRQDGVRQRYSKRG